MAYLSLYRKYRSQDFRSIVGQEHIVKTLENAINNNRLSHAYIFSGPRGTGKTSMARILAKSLNCREGSGVQPCLKCDLCEAIKNGTAMDVIEIDAASNRGIDEIRQLREQVNFMPAEGKYKVYIIDEVHMLTNEAFNALLKTLEEPPSFTIFVLATTEVQKIPPTILSRCQRLDFKRISVADVAEHLKMIASREGVKIDERSLQFIARVNDGSMRDAISLLDQLISFRGKEIKFEDVLDVLGTADFVALAKLVDLLAVKNLEGLVSYIEQVIAEGKNILQLNKDLVEYLRNLLFTKVGAVSAVDVSTENLGKLKEQAALFTLDQLKKQLLLFSKADADMRWQQNMKLVFELAVLEACTDKPQQQGAAPVQSASVPQSFQSLKATLQQSVQEPAPKQVVSSAAVTATVPTSFKQMLGSATREAVVAAPEKVIEKPAPAAAVPKQQITDIKQLWPLLLNKIKIVRPKIYVLLCESEPLDLNGEKMRVKFKDNFSFHRDKLIQEENKKTMESLLTEIAGKPLQLEALLDRELNPGKELSSNKDKEDEVDEHTENLLGIFQGKIVPA